MIDNKLHPEFFHDLRAGISNTISCRVAIACNAGWIKVGTIPVTMDDCKFSPILLDAPRIKESIDVEDNKFKISDVSLNISNIKLPNKMIVGGEPSWYYSNLGGPSPVVAPGWQHSIGNNEKPPISYYDRFSDILEVDSLMNAKTLIFFDTPNSINRDNNKWVEILNETLGGSDQMLDYFLNQPDTPWFWRGPLVFRGSVVKVVHDDTKATITLEDLTSQQFHKDIPSHEISNVDGEKTIKFPITYGHVDFAPTVQKGKSTFAADSEPYKLIVDPQDSHYDSMSNRTNEYYQTHPSWGVVDGWKENIGLSPIRMIYDETPIYIPIYILKEIEDTKFEIDLDDGVSYEEERQWNSSYSSPGRITFVPTVLTHANMIQAFGIMKPTDLQFHLRLVNYTNGSDNFRTFWRDNVQSQDRHTERFYDIMTDDNYPNFNRSIEWVNGYDPGHGSEYWSTATGTNWDVFNSGFQHFNLLRFKICTDVFKYTDEYMQFAINKFRFPPMSKNKSNPTHFYYITSHSDSQYGGVSSFRDGIDFSDEAQESGNPDSGIPPSTTPPVIDLGTSITYISNHDGNIKCSSLQGNKFKDIFTFPTFINDTFYTGYTDYDFAIGAPNHQISITNDERNFLQRTSQEGWDTSYVQISNRHDYFDGGSSPGINLCFGLHGKGDTSASPALSCHLTGGFWQEVDLCLLADIEGYQNYDVFLNSAGRYDNEGRTIDNPIAIIRDLIEREIDNSVDFDEDSYNDALEAYNGWEFGFSLTDVMSSKEVIEQIAKNTLCFPHFKNNGKFTFPHMAKKDYNLSDWQSATEIKSVDVISYKFKKTNQDKVPSRIDIFGKKNYYKDEYEIAKVNWELTKLDDALLKFNGYQYNDDNILELETDYIRKSGTIMSFASEQKHFKKIQKNIIDLRVPLKYIDIEVGDVIKFDQLIDGIKAYGNDYTKVTQIALNETEDNCVWTYPLFFVTSTQKSLKELKLTAIQLHQLDDEYGGDLRHRDEWDTAGLASNWGDWTPPDIPSVDWENIPLIPRWTQGHDFSYVFRPNKNLSLVMYNLLPLDPWGNSNPQHYVLQGIADGNYDGWELAETLFNHPSRWGLSSWDELIPNDWSEFQNSTFRRNYRAIRIEFTHPDVHAPSSNTPSQATNPGWTRYLSWGNIVDTDNPDEMEFDWFWEDISNEDFYFGGEGFGSTSSYQSTNPETYPYFPGLAYESYFTDFQHDSICRFYYGAEFNAAIDKGVVDAQYLSYIKPPTSTIVGPAHPGKGDANQDFNISLLDMSKMLIMMYDYSEDPRYGYIGQEWSFLDMDNNNAFNVGDAIKILEIVSGTEFEGEVSDGGWQG